ASAAVPDPARAVAVSVRNQVHQAVALSAPATEHPGSPIPHEAAGGGLFDQRRLRFGDSSAGDTVTVSADEATEEDFDADGVSCVGLLRACPVWLLRGDSAPQVPGRVRSDKRS